MVFSKKYRWILGLLAVALSVMLVAGCGGGGKSADTAKKAIDYPKKPIEIIVPYSAGGGQDVTSRITAKYLEKYLPNNTKVVVTNVPAGGGVQGATTISNMKPDGYQVGALVPFQFTDQFIMKGITYNEKSFVPVAMVSDDANFIVVRKDLGVKNMKEFIALAKSKPEQITMGMGGNWNVHDFLRLKVEKATGAKFKRMPFNGGAPALAAVAGGNCDSASQSISEALAAMEAGHVVAIAVTSAERSPLAPNVPTLKEQGIDVVHAQWRGFVVTPGTPEEVIKILSDALKKVYDDKGWQEEAKKAGLAPKFMDYKQFGEFYKKDFEVYKNLINELGIKPQ